MGTLGPTFSHLNKSLRGLKLLFLLKFKLRMSKVRTHNLNYIQEARDIPEAFLSDVIFCSTTTFFTNV